MSSTIMYKFRMSTSFETISMPGTSARLFDVKKAIVKAKKLDRSGAGTQLEFDLGVKNAMTNEQYDDENMLLPRGTRVIVQRLPAIKGQGLLARIARAEAGMTNAIGAVPPVKYGNIAAAESGFYKVQSGNDEDEFIDTAQVAAANKANAEASVKTEEDELAELKAVTDQAGSMYRHNITRSTQATKSGNTLGAPGMSSAPPAYQHHSNPHHSKAPSTRPNADPELREQEARARGGTSKRQTGIPRTFLNISSASANDNADNGDGTGADGGGGGASMKLQPNRIVFEALINRGGGQSGTGAHGKRRDIDYALKLTATEIPDHLKCGICGTVVREAMLIPWDMEGRTACEVCIRDGLAKNAFVCPLTGQQDVSPDDLHPNRGLRKAAELFVNGVMEKMDLIVEQQEAEDEQERDKAVQEAQANPTKTYEGDSIEKGIVVTRRGGNTKNSKKQSDDDFGDDDFGGDVFDVEEDEFGEEAEEEKQKSNDVSDKDKLVTEMAKTATAGKTLKNNSSSKTEGQTNSDVDNSNKPIGGTLSTSQQMNGGRNTVSEKVMSNAPSLSNNSANSSDAPNAAQLTDENNDNTNQKIANSPRPNRREIVKSRAPPAGYVMGPAGGTNNNGPPSYPPPNSFHQTPYNNNGGGRGQYYHNNNNSFHPEGGRQNFHPGGRGRFQRNQPFHQGRGFRGGPGGRGGRDFHQQHYPQDEQNYTEGNSNQGQKRHFNQVEGSNLPNGQERRPNQPMWPRGGRGNFGRGGPVFDRGGRMMGRGRSGFHRGGFQGGRGRGWDNYGGRGRGRYGGRGF